MPQTCQLSHNNASPSKFKGYRHVRSVQTLLDFKMPKATESISRHQGLFTLWRCKFAPGELLKGEGATCELTPQLRWTGQHATWRITSAPLTSSKQTHNTSFNMYVTLSKRHVLGPLQLWATIWLMGTALIYEFQNRNAMILPMRFLPRTVVRLGFGLQEMSCGVRCYLMTDVSGQPIDRQNVPKRRWRMENDSTTLGHVFRAWFVTGGPARTQHFCIIPITHSHEVFERVCGILIVRLSSLQSMSLKHQPRLIILQVPLAYHISVTDRVPAHGRKNSFKTSLVLGHKAKKVCSPRMVRYNTRLYQDR